MRWLVQYVLRLYSNFEADLEADMKANNLSIQRPGSAILHDSNLPDRSRTLERIGVIEVRDFDKTCSNYINQLLRQQRFRHALTICHYIGHAKMKKRMVFDVLGVIGGVM